MVFLDSMKNEGDIGLIDSKDEEISELKEILDDRNIDY